MSGELQAINRQNNLTEWADRIRACRSSELSTRQWCAENGISLNTYYKWQRRVFEAAKAQQKQFIEIGAGQTAGSPAVVGCAVVTLRGNGLSADIYSGIEQHTLELLCRAMRHAE